MVKNVKDGKTYKGNAKRKTKLITDKIEIRQKVLKEKRIHCNTNDYNHNRDILISNNMLVTFLKQKRNYANRNRSA